MAAGAELRDFFESGLRHHDSQAVTEELDLQTVTAYRTLREGTDDAGRLSADAEEAVHAQWAALRERLGDGDSPLRARTRAVWLYAHNQQRSLETERRAHADEQQEHEETRASWPPSSNRRTAGWLT